MLCYSNKGRNAVVAGGSGSEHLSSEMILCGRKTARLLLIRLCCCCMATISVSFLTRRLLASLVFFRKTDLYSQLWFSCFPALEKLTEISLISRIQTSLVSLTWISSFRLQSWSMIGTWMFVESVLKALWSDFHKLVYNCRHFIEPVQQFSSLNRWVVFLLVLRQPDHLTVC